VTGVCRTLQDISFTLDAIPSRPEPKRIMMSPPTYCDVAGVDQHRALAQWKQLREQFRAAGFDVVIVPEQAGLGEMMLTAAHGISLLRMDLDTTTRKGSHDKLLKKFGTGEADILLGTQMVAKGLDFSRVTLVGVISADTQMLLPDFRASERTFQLLTQVAGRAGRSSLEGEVIIQTYQPTHYALKHVVTHDFKSFYQEELQYRKELQYPPMSRLALLEFRGEHENNVMQHAEEFSSLLKKVQQRIIVLGPAPAAIAKLKQRYRWHLVLKSVKDNDPAGTILHRAIHQTVAAFQNSSSGRKKNVQLIIDVDPISMM